VKRREFITLLGGAAVTKGLRPVVSERRVGARVLAICAFAADRGMSP
jgi:hypothetical protein